MIKALVGIGFAVALLSFNARLSANERELEPRVIRSVKELRDGEGAVLLSVRSQVMLAQTLHIWFAYDSSSATADTLRFERKSTIGRAALLARHVKVYAIPAGTYRLRTHTVGCDDEPAAGQLCTFFVNGVTIPLPTSSYSPGWVTLTVEAGRFLDANELNLELPPGTVGPLTAGETHASRVASIKLKFRDIPSSEKAAGAPFASLPKGGELVVGPNAASAIKCEKPPSETKGAFYPFDC